MLELVVLGQEANEADERRQVDSRDVRAVKNRDRDELVEAGPATARLGCLDVTTALNERGERRRLPVRRGACGCG